MNSAKGSFMDKEAIAKQFMEQYVSKGKTQEGMVDFLRERIIGQDDAVVDAAETIFTRRHNRELPKPPKDAVKGPLANLLFVGPPGVGKTQMAFEISEYLFDNAALHIKCDNLARHSSEWTAYLFGQPSGYQGSKIGYLAENLIASERVLLFDEVHLGPQGFFESMLSLLETGVFPDKYQGRPVDITRSVVVMTSNDKYEDLLKIRSENEDPHDRLQLYREKLLQNSVLPEPILRRFHQIIIFVPPTPTGLLDLIETTIKDRAEANGIDLQRIETNAGAKLLGLANAQAARAGYTAVASIVSGNIDVPMRKLRQQPGFEAKSYRLTLDEAGKFVLLPLTEARA
jgi:ATP-dependent Clp protease ATP-binding subunit ClpC